MFFWLRCFTVSESRGSARPANAKTLRAVAVVLLFIPIVALMLVPTYAKEGPELAGFPFFFWYQFLWVFLCSGLTYAAHRLVLAARGPRPRFTPDEEGQR